MRAVQDFNYKVALASGLKHLQGGKLRQAEEQFRYLVSKFPAADGGYRGLARVQVELGDRAAALATLRDGAAAMSRAGERSVAIDLLREATMLDPLDLSAHRRLAAALALAGDIAAAAGEYVRFANAEIAAGDPDRARLEASYALETLGEIPALHDLARTVGLTLRTQPRYAPAPEAAPTEAPPPAPAAEPEAEVAPAAAEETYEAPAGEPAWTLPEGAPQPPWVQPAETGEDPRIAAAAAWAASRPASLQQREAQGGEATAPEPEALEETVDPRLAFTLPAPPPAAAVPPPPRVDPLELEARAVALIAARDAEAGTVAIEAARALADAGKVHAASDLLMQLVASGTSVHEAQRELVAIAHALGRSEIAAEREQLLARVASLG